LGLSTTSHEPTRHERRDTHHRSPQPISPTAPAQYPTEPEAWIDDSKTVIGYEISFNKYFYVHQPLRELAEVVKEIRDLEAETEGLLEHILSFSSADH
jgi:hypothetical protein